MLYKVILSIFLISTMTFIMWMMFTIQINNTDYKMKSVQFRRYLEASPLVTTSSRPRNDTFYQKAINRIVTGLKREFSSKERYHSYLQIYN